MRVSFGTRSPQALRFSARSEGGGSGPHTGHCFARPVVLRCARLARAIAPHLSAARTARVPDTRRSCEAAAVWTPLPTPAGCAEKRRGWGGCVCRRTHALRDLACRSCLSGVRRTQRVLRHHPRSEHRRLPPSPTGRRGTQTGGRLLFGDFLLAAKRKLLRRRAHTPASALGKRTEATTDTRPQHHASPAGPRPAPRPQPKHATTPRPAATTKRRPPHIS
jgi:hypothetical protein